ncbi:MAG TPA: hypothetical protein VGD98_25195 [Ktedonobacteraceae bacterium]
MSTIVSNDYSKFVGLWVSHSAFMRIASAGNIQFEARAYNWCGPKVQQPCDSIVADRLRYGYREQMQLVNANDAVAYGTITDSNMRSGNIHKAITLTLGPEDTLIYTNGQTIAFLCGASAPTDTCGA